MVKAGSDAHMAAVVDLTFGPVDGELPPSGARGARRRAAAEVAEAAGAEAAGAEAVEVVKAAEAVEAAEVEAVPRRPVPVPVPVPVSVSVRFERVADHVADPDLAAEVHVHRSVLRALETEASSTTYMYRQLHMPHVPAAMCVRSHVCLQTVAVCVCSRMCLPAA